MSPEEWDAWLRGSLEDRRLSRGERQEFGEMAATLAGPAARDELRRQAFAIARESWEAAGPGVLDWLEDIVRTLRESPAATVPVGLAEVYFSPSEDCLKAIQRYLGRASRTADLCVFTITDDRLAESILDLRRRRVQVRIITDDDKAEDLGSDIGRFERAEIPLRVDRSPAHMHHKFAILDGQYLLNGSYNWTRGAARDNEENLVVSDDPRLIRAFQGAFDRLWERLG